MTSSTQTQQLTASNSSDKKLSDISKELLNQKNQLIETPSKIRTKHSINRVASSG